MKQNHFIYNGHKYYTGTIIKIKSFANGEITGKEATFLYYNTDNDYYMYTLGNKHISVHSDIFWNNFINVTDKLNSSAHMPIEKHFKDTEVDNLFIGWMWYILIMLIAVIFKSAIFIWAITIIIFFKWRKKKIKEEGTYYEW